MNLLLLNSSHSKERSLGKSLKLEEKFLGKEVTPFKYWPTDQRFWNNYESLIRDKKIDKALGFAQKQLERFGDESLEGAEAKLAVAKVLFKKGYSHASFTTLIELAENQIGSRVGEAAIYELSLLTKKSIYDNMTLENLLNSNEFSGMHPHVQSFIGYHKGMRAMIFGYDKWAKKYLLEVEPKSYWANLFRYWSAVGEVSRDKIGTAKEMFSNLYGQRELESSLRDLAGLQLARIEFEDGNFDMSYSIYSRLNPPNLRERGRIQLERAWAQYYTGKYSKALGLLSSLRAPYFRPSLNPEKFVLEMLIYRKLCHYQTASSIAQMFQETYKNSIKAIQNRRPLSKDKVLLSIGLMNKDVQDQANLIDLIRKEKRKIKSDKVSRQFLKEILYSYKDTDKRLQMQISLKIESQIKKIADELLDTQEQILFLDYRSKIDTSKVILPQAERSYASEKIPYTTFDQIYWPVQRLFGVTEYWANEFEDYNMLISSRCHSSNMEKEPNQRDLEGKFK